MQPRQFDFPFLDSTDGDAVAEEFELALADYQRSYRWSLHYEMDDGSRYWSATVLNEELAEQSVQTVLSLRDRLKEILDGKTTDNSLYLQALWVLDGDFEPGTDCDHVTPYEPEGRPSTDFFRRLDDAKFMKRCELLDVERLQHLIVELETASTEKRMFDYFSEARDLDHHSRIAADILRKRSLPAVAGDAVLVSAPHRKDDSTLLSWIPVGERVLIDGDVAPMWIYLRSAESLEILSQNARIREEKIDALIFEPVRRRLVEVRQKLAELNAHPKFSAINALPLDSKRYAIRKHTFGFNEWEEAREDLWIEREGLEYHIDDLARQPPAEVDFARWETIRQAQARAVLAKELGFLPSGGDSSRSGEMFDQNHPIGMRLLQAELRGHATFEEVVDLCREEVRLANGLRTARENPVRDASFLGEPAF